MVESLFTYSKYADMYGIESCICNTNSIPQQHSKQYLCHGPRQKYKPLRPNNSKIACTTPKSHVPTTPFSQEHANHIRLVFEDRSVTALHERLAMESCRQGCPGQPALAASESSILHITVDGMDQAPGQVALFVHGPSHPPPY